MINMYSDNPKSFYRKSMRSLKSLKSHFSHKTAKSSQDSDFSINSLNAPPSNCYDNLCDQYEGKQFV